MSASSTANSQARVDLQQFICQSKTMPRYVNDGASPEQARAYASCVQVIYPAQSDELTKNEKKICMVVLLLAFFVGAICSFRILRRNMDRSGAAVGALFGGLISVVCVGGLFVAMVLVIEVWKFMLS